MTQATRSLTASNITSLLLKSNQGLIIGTLDQVEPSEKENVKLGMNTILRIGSKRIRGTIVRLGTSSQCEKARKTICLPSAQVQSQPIRLMQSLGEISLNSSTTSSQQSKILNEKQSKKSTKSAERGNNSIKGHRIVEKTDTTRQISTTDDEDEENSLVVDQTNFEHQTTQQKSKATKRKITAMVIETLPRRNLLKTLR